MTPTRPWTLAIIAIAAGLAAWLIVRATFTSLPPLPWTSVPTLLLLAVAEGLSGRNLRARVLGRGSAKPMSPIAMARMAVLAKASSVAAAAVGGFAAGFLAYVAASLEKPVPRSRSAPPSPPPSSWWPRPCTLSTAAALLSRLTRDRTARRTARDSGAPAAAGRDAGRGTLWPGRGADILAWTVRYPARTGTRWTMTN